MSSTCIAIFKKAVRCLHYTIIKPKVLNRFRKTGKCSKRIVPKIIPQLSILRPKGKRKKKKQLKNSHRSHWGWGRYSSSNSRLWEASSCLVAGGWGVDHCEGPESPHWDCPGEVVSGRPWNAPWPYEETGYSYANAWTIFNLQSLHFRKCKCTTSSKPRLQGCLPKMPLCSFAV